MYDRQCPECQYELIDCLEPVADVAGHNPDVSHFPTAPIVLCPNCQTETERIFSARAPNIIPDDIPGGVLIRHGICNDDGTPRKYYSKSEMTRAAKEKGLINLVEHKTLPGTDKSPHTTRWI